MTPEEAQDRLALLIQEALATAAQEGLLDDDNEVAMVTDWVLVVDTIFADGDTGTAVIHPTDQRLPEAHKLLSVGSIVIEEGLREWARGYHDG